MASPVAMTTKSSDQTTGASLLLFTAEKNTPFSPALLERMARVKTLHAQISKMVDKIRFVAQTNPAFRGERLVASAVNQVSDRMQYATALKDASLACFDNIKPLCEHADEISSAMNAIAGYEDVFLRQVQIFGVKPLKDFITIVYPKIMAEFAELEKRRDKFDLARNKKALTTPQAQQQLLEQADTLAASLDKVAEQQLQLAKCIDVFARGECQLLKEAKAVIDAVRPPDYKKRWASPP